jgi:lipid II:glycine glycyltransferase (peptidoglycan interpeptide bridge formation enzyme)
MGTTSIGDSIRCELLTSLNYESFFEECSKHLLVPPFLSPKYSPELWGVVARVNNLIVGGWIGKLRGVKPLLSHFVKGGVWFDSLPLVFPHVAESLLAFDVILAYAKTQAKNDRIISLNVTHWSRQRIETNHIFDKDTINATFTIDLHKEKDELWSQLDATLRNKIRKAEKNNICVHIGKGEDALTCLDIFQNLRQETQSRAIRRNKNASMLLKSNQFFTNILLNQNSWLISATYQDEIVSVALMVIAGQTVYYFSGGSNIEINRKTAASSLLVWKTIEYAKAQGLRIFDFGGVPVAPDEAHPAYGVYKFKKSFGGEYQEFCSGEIIVRKRIYPMVNLVLNNRILLRLLSKHV